MSALTVVETGEIVEQMTPVEAERITARIADKLDAIADNLEQVLPLIGEALTRRAWESLGYQSAQSYVSERFAASLSRLSPDVRRPVVAELSAAGMSTRQIAPIVGVQQPAVAKDLAKSRQVIPLESRHESVGSIDTPASSTPHGLPVSHKIIGADGKEYTRPAPQIPVEVDDPATPQQAPAIPRRPPLPDQIFRAVYDLGKNIERLERLMADDRFPRNKSEAASRHGSDLTRYANTLNKLVANLN